MALAEEKALNSVPEGPLKTGDESFGPIPYVRVAPNEMLAKYLSSSIHFDKQARNQCMFM